jgi:hypothetical protein
MLKELLGLSFVCLLSACSSHNTPTQTNVAAGQLSVLLATDSKDLSMLHQLSKQMVVQKNWQSAFFGYQSLCRQQTKKQQYFCSLMWSSAQQSKDAMRLFSAAATSYSLTKQDNWLRVMQVHGTSEIQQLIAKTLQNIPLTDQQLITLASSPRHYAQALFIRGKQDKDGDLLNQARLLFIEQQSWFDAADSMLLLSQLSLSNEKRADATENFHLALLYYDLANAEQKFDLALRWGKVHGFIR